MSSAERDATSSEDIGKLRLEPSAAPLLNNPVSLLSVDGPDHEVGGDLGICMVDPDTAQAIRPAAAGGEQRATATRFFAASLGDRDGRHVGEWNRMRKMQLTVSEPITFDSEAVSMLAKDGIAADVLAVDRESDMNTRGGVVAPHAVVQWNPPRRWPALCLEPSRSVARLSPLAVGSSVTTYLSAALADGADRSIPDVRVHG